MKNSRISICIPGYNRPGLLEKTLNSIIDQTAAPFEVIVVDDCSKEDMSKVEKLCRENGFKYVKNEKNLGLMNNFNNAIKKASGDYIALVHNDDLVSRYYIEEIEKFTQKYPTYNIYATNCAGIDFNDNIIADYRLYPKDKVIQKTAGLRELWKKDFFCFLSILGSTIYKKEFLQENLFDVSWGNEADLDSALKFFSLEDIMYVDRPIYFTRIHQDQESNKIKRTEDSLKNYIKNRLDIYSRYDFSINLYMEKIKAVHVVQLLWKYKYSIRQVKEMLKIESLREWLVIIVLIPKIALSELGKKIKLLLYKKEISRYLKG